MALRWNGSARALLLAVLACLPATPARAGSAQEPAPMPEAPPAPSAAPAVAAEYRLQPGDTVEIGVLPREEFGGTVTVSPDGTVQLKRVGSLRAAGMTVVELAAAIEEALKKELRRPQVTVTLRTLAQPLQVPQVTVAGAVTKPGPVNLEPGLRVRKAIDLAGGTSNDADLKRVTIIHPDLTRTVVDLSQDRNLTDPAHNRILRDRDSIDVPRLGQFQITVSGAVSKPGPVAFEEGLRVRKALDLAGGVTENSDLRRVTIIHRDLSRTTVDLSSEERITDPGHNRLLQEGDSIEVPSTFQKGFVSVAGAVAKPGTFELQPGWALDDLIVAAEKLTLVADVEQVELRRPGAPIRKINLLEQQKQGARGRVVLQAGDEVFIPEAANRVLVVGPITNPGAMSLTPGQTLQEFFTKGHPETLTGLDPSKVDVKQAQLIRQGQNPMKFDLRKILGNPDPKQNVVLQSGDVIYLPPLERKQKATLADYLRVLPFFGTIFGLFGE